MTPTGTVVVGTDGSILLATCPVTIVRPTKVGEAITVEPTLATQGA
jgi:hypothetical protein